MRVNPRVYTETNKDLDGRITIPTITAQPLRKICENIMNMITRPGYSAPTYHKVSELDKLITLDYWREYDGLNSILFHSGKYFDDWYRNEATEPSWIGRAIETLRQRNYIILDEAVEANARKAHDNMAKAMRR
jgi:hypothetical protein